MRIAFFAGTFFPDPGGVQVQLHNLSNKLVNDGHEVSCFLYNKTNIDNNYYKILYLNKFLTSLVYFFDYYFSININFFLKIYLKKLFEKKKFDIAHFHFINFKSLIIIECLNQLKIKTVVSFHGADLQINKKIKYGYRLDEKFDLKLRNIINKVDKFFYISQTIKKDLEELGIEKKKLFFSPNSVYIKKFSELNKNVINKRHQINLITVARFAEKKKGYDKLVNISKNLIENKIKFKWTIIGERTSKLLSNDLILKNKLNFEIFENIPNNDEFFYPHSDLIKKYLQADIYVNLARVESFGITFIESLASDVPVLTYDTKGANELVINNYNGFIVDNDKELIKKIIDLSKNKNLINVLKKNLKNSIMQYDLDLATKSIILEYQNIKNKHNARK